MIYNIRKVTRYSIVFFVSTLSVWFIINVLLWKKSSIYPESINDFYLLNSVSEKYWSERVKQFCETARSRLQEEKIDQLTTVNSRHYRQPNRNTTNNEQSTISYYYSLWHSYPKLSRRLTICDHTIYMELLITLDKLLHQHEVNYFITDGTLLGEYKRFFVLIIVISRSTLDNDYRKFHVS